MYGKKYVICGAAAVIVLIGISFVIGDRGGSPSVEESGADSVYSVPETETRPVKISADTEGEQSGGDILYKHGGLTVSLIESHLSGDAPSVRLLFENDTENTMIFKTDYVVINGMATDHSTLAIVEPGGEEQRSLTYLDEYLPEGESADDITVRFCFNEEGDNSSKTYSEPIDIVYEEAEHNYTRPENARLIWECGDFRVYECGAETEYSEESGESGIAVNIWAENDGDNDYTLTDGDEAYYELDGERIGLDGFVYARCPARTVRADKLSFEFADRENSAPEEIAVSFSLRNSDDYFVVGESGDITIPIK